MASKKFIVGIDEVGRGPLAGPVSVGIVLCQSHFLIEGVRDSKVMTEAAREAVFALALERQKSGDLSFGVFSVSAAQIDRDGIEAALLRAIEIGLAELAPNPADVEVVLDGRLKAPREYRQQALIHGDALVPAIALASIVAKVTRDHYMAGTVHKKFPLYGFDAHKGYGTRAHYAAIAAHGITPIHRRSFLRGSVIKSHHD